MQDFSRHNSHDSLSASGGMSTCSPTSSHDHHDIQNYTSTHTNLDLHKNISDSITTQASTSAVFASAAAPPPSEEAIHDLPSVLFVQMELLSGRTLKDWLRDDMGRRNPDSGDVTGASTLDASAGVREDAMWQVEVCAVFRQVLQALDHVHGLGFVHRDVKPDNVFLAQESDVAAPMVKIGDFGLSVRCDLADGAPASDVVPSTGGPGAVGLHTAGVGTHLYASPEQVRGQACDGRADMFAVGVMLYESLCGPFATSMERVHVLGELATGSGVGFSSHFCDLHSRFPDLMNVVKGLLQLDPHSRPTAGTLLRDPIFCQHQLAPAPSAGLAERVELAHVVREQELLIAVLRAQLQRASPPDPGHVNVAHTDPGRYTRIEC
jgi:serine/threonine protein kinase